MGKYLRGIAFHTPIGALVAVAAERGRRRVSCDLSDLDDGEQAPDPTLDALARWLDAYFGRRTDQLEQPPLDLPQTPSLPIWQAARSVPFGSRWTYGDLARRLSRPSSARAVGAAMSANPILLLVPCHRVIAQSGSLAGYRGGIERKAWLLKHEGALLL